jgi:carboxypeptidase C (cathepsin A)
MATPLFQRPLIGPSIALAALLVAAPGRGQESHEPAKGEEPSEQENGSLPERALPADMVLTRSAQVTIRGARVPYRVTTGTQPVYGEDGKTIAALHYTYYERSDVEDATRRRCSSPSTVVPAPARCGCTSATPARSCW